jgi:hypothetical protein
MIPLEHIGTEVSRNKQVVRGTGTRTSLVLSGSPHPLLYLPSDRGNETGARNDGGEPNRFIRTLRKLPGKCIWFNVTSPGSIGQLNLSKNSDQQACLEFSLLADRIYSRLR